MFVPFHALASRLVGFKSDRLRVLVQRIDSGNAFVRTADLLDAGTPLTLTTAQLDLVDETKVRVALDGEVPNVTTWGEFKADNAGDESLGDIEADLVNLGKHEGGGGAGVAFVVSLFGGK